MKISLKTEAQKYTEHGMPVGPAEQKRILIKNWSNLSSEQFLENKYEEYWKNATGLGLLCGKPSGVIGLDIDLLLSKCDENLLKKIESYLPPILSGKSGHPDKRPTQFFRYNGEKGRKFNNIHVEILSDGNQTIIPPSKHPDFNKKYEWVGQPLYNIDIDDLPFLPSGFLEVLENLNELYKKEKGKEEIELIPSEGRCKHGSHNKISSLATALFHSGYPFDRLVKRVISEDRKINHDADSLYFECKTRKWKSKDAKTNAEEFVEEIFKNYGPGGKKETKENKEDHYKQIVQAGFFKTVEKGKAVIDIPCYQEMARYFKEDLHFKCDDSYQAIYTGKKYDYISGLGLRKKIKDLASPAMNPGHLEGFVKMIKADCYMRKADFVPADRLINLNNGVLNIDTGHLLTHNPNHNFTYVLEHDYNKEAKCPNFLKYLKYVFNDDEDLVKIVGEMFGYTIIGGYPYAHKAFMLYGSGRNGKSTLLEVIRGLLGADNISSVSMKRINKEFSMVRLDGKLANVVEESPSAIDNESFKNIVGGGVVTAAKKGMDEYDLVIHARMFFACNDFPHFKDSTVATRDRLVILPFNRYIEESQRDYKIHEKLKLELSGILNFALDGLRRYESQSCKFTKSKLSDDVFGEYVKETDTVADWCDENIKESSDSLIEYPIRKLYAAYKKDCIENGSYAVNKNNFAKRLKTIIDEKHYFKNREKRGYKDIVCLSRNYESFN